LKDLKSFPKKAGAKLSFVGENAKDFGKAYLFK
jgi:hypothetical protein